MNKFRTILVTMLVALMSGHVMADPGAKQALKASQSHMIGLKLSAGLVGVAVLSGVVGRSGSGGNGNGNGNGGGGGVGGGGGNGGGNGGGSGTGTLP